MSAPSMSEIADKLAEYKKKDTEKGIKWEKHPVEIDSHTLAWAEYWIRYADLLLAKEVEP